MFPIVFTQMTIYHTVFALAFFILYMLVCSPWVNTVLLNYNYESHLKTVKCL